jgi:hypothetical protein
VDLKTGKIFKKNTSRENYLFNNLYSTVTPLQNILSFF